MIGVVADVAGSNRKLESDSGSVARELQDLFGTDFSLWSRSGALLCAGEQSWLAEQLSPEALQSVSDSSDPSILARSDCHYRLALPLITKSEQPVLAVADFLNGTPELADLRFWLGDSPEVAMWHAQASNWSEDSLLRMGKSAQRVLQQTSFVKNLDEENQELLQRLSSVFEEINLIYGVTKNLTLATIPRDLGLKALRMLSGTLSVQGTALWLTPGSEERGVSGHPANNNIWLTAGECPIGEDDFRLLVEQHSIDSNDPVVINAATRSEDDWSFPTVRSVVLVPVASAGTQFGWIAGFNHINDEELGTEEAGLIASIAALLTVHSGNRDLYDQQTDMVESVVTSLASTVDAKDPYTRGHSERVAAISVLLARELGWSSEQLKTMHMAGLLHDIGKICVNDDVLQKPGALTDDEYAQIKKHPELGFNILRGIKQLADILPAVLHHHENWDGTGYPRGLAEEGIPEIARIMAVADAYDAMTSNRPYRNGMPLEKVETIFRKGSDQQWDARVVDAYFRIRDDVSKVRSVG